jgi:hypothetical protein
MCRDCWIGASSPTEWSSETERVVDLVRELYDLPGCGVGGPLHVALDDCNLDVREIEPWYNGWSGENLDALHYQGVPVAELDPGSPAAVEGLGVSIRQVCDEIAAILNRMTVPQRYAAMAYWDGYAARPA